MTTTESSLPVGRKINAAVAREVMGWLEWDFVGDWNPPKGRELDTMFTAEGYEQHGDLAVYEGGDDDVTFWFAPRTDMRSAMLVIKQIRKRFDTVHLYIGPDGARCEIGDANAPGPFAVAEENSASKLPQAICRAALLAVRRGR